MDTKLLQAQMVHSMESKVSLGSIHCSLEEEDESSQGRQRNKANNLRMGTYNIRAMSNG
jgi:hypothetical protein